MKEFLTHLLVGALLCGLVLPSCEATTCTDSRNVCHTTLRVTKDCDGTNCECDGDAYVAKDTGCVSFSFDKPVVKGGSAGEWSGEVLASGSAQTLTMTCVLQGADTMSNLEYTWFEGANTDGGSTTKTLQKALTISDGDSIDYQCSVKNADFTSEKSDVFNIKGYAAATSFTINPTIEVENGFTSVAGDTHEVNFKCMNRPVGTNIYYDWNNEAASKDSDYAVASGDGTSTCRVKDANDDVVGTSDGKDPLSVTEFTDLGAKIVTPSSDVTIEKGQAYALTCGPSVDELAYDTGDVAWSWKIDDVDAGQNTATMNFPTNNDADEYKVTCHASWNSGTVKDSEAITVTVVTADSVLGAASVELSPAGPIKDGYMTLKCLVFAKSLDGLTYSWTYDGATIPGQDDHTLQVNELDNAKHGNGKAYTCKVTSSTIVEDSADSAVTVKELTNTDQTPVVRSNLEAGYRFGHGDTYKLTCDASRFYSPGMTYKWWEGSDEKSETSQTIEITASESVVEYKCQAIFDTYSSKESAVFPVEGFNITKLEMDVVVSPVKGTSQTITCKASTAKSVSDTVTYMIHQNTDKRSDTSTHTIDSFADANNGPWNCTATVNGESEMISIPVEGVDTPVKPGVTLAEAEGTNNNGNTFTKGGTYTLVCTSPSHDSSATYQWVKDDKTSEPLSSTGHTHKISSAASSDAGDYKCKVTINSQASSFSDNAEMKYDEAKGRICTKTDFPTVCADRAYYTGQCLEERCQCADGVDLRQDNCSNDDSDGSDDSSSMIAASTLLLLGAWLVTIIL